MREAPRGGAQSPYAATTLWQRPGAAADWVGRPVLGLMVNGAQGDDDEAHGGHFAIVTGRVQADGGIGDWLVDNFYSLDVESEKGIIAAPVPLDNYLADLNSGQGWYRPSTMLVAVLQDERAAVLVQSALNRVFNQFYRHQLVYYHPNQNCASISVDTLRALGWEVPARGPSSRVLAWVAYPFIAVRDRSIGKAKLAFDYLRTDQTRLMPAAALEQAFASLWAMAQGTPSARTASSGRCWRRTFRRWLSLRFPQFPSSRAFGDAPAVSTWEYRTRVPERSGAGADRAGAAAPVPAGVARRRPAAGALDAGRLGDAGLVRALGRRRAAAAVALVAASPPSTEAAEYTRRMIVLGIESSCDETGVALVQARGGEVPTLLAQALHSQVDMHRAYGGVVPELASRDHIRRVLPLTRQVLAEAGTRAGGGRCRRLHARSGAGRRAARRRGRRLRARRRARQAGARRAPPRGPSAVAVSLGRSAALPVHRAARFGRAHAADARRRRGALHPARRDHRRRGGRGLRQDGQDDGPALSRRAGAGAAGGVRRRRGVRPAAAAAAQRQPRLLVLRPEDGGDDGSCASSAATCANRTRRTWPRRRRRRSSTCWCTSRWPRSTPAASTGWSSPAAWAPTSICASASTRGAPRAARGVHYPELALCTDNGAMIALAAAMRLQRGLADCSRDYSFDVLPRWPLAPA